MSSDDAERAEVRLKWNGGYVFRVAFPGTQSQEIIMDEPPPLGSLKGPNASRVLVSAIANCLSASLLFCLQKSRVEVDDIETIAYPMVKRNQEGYWRVSQVEVSIKLKLKVPEDDSRVKRCLAIFENYCVVTGAVKAGFPVNIEVKTGGEM